MSLDVKKAEDQIADEAELDRAPLGREPSAHALRRPFWLAGDAGARGRVGVLLVHGFTGSPFEMRLLGEALAARGHTVYAPRLAGHGQTSLALGRSTHEDWMETVELAFARLRAEVERVVVCGLSLGGLLTLELARRHGPEAIAAIQVLAAPLWLARPVEVAIALTRRLGRVPALTLPKLAGSDISDPQMRARNNLAQGAVGLPIPAVLELRSFMDQVRAGLGEVRTPTLLMHSPLDHTAPYACMAALQSALGSAEIETISLSRSFHVVTLDVEREEVIRAVARHIDQHTQRPSA